MMSTNKAIRYLPLLLMFVFGSGFNVYAEKLPVKVVEIAALKIKLSNDGTGIVQGIRCKGCDFNFVKITENSRASIQGMEVSIFEARKRAGFPAMVSFSPESQEVQYIRW